MYRLNFLTSFCPSSGIKFTPVYIVSDIRMEECHILFETIAEVCHVLKPVIRAASDTLCSPVSNRCALFLSLIFRTNSLGLKFCQSFYFTIEGRITHVHTINHKSGVYFLYIQIIFYQ